MIALVKAVNCVGLDEEWIDEAKYSALAGIHSVEISELGIARDLLREPAILESICRLVVTLIRRGSAPLRRAHNLALAAHLEALDDDANRLLSDAWILVTNDQAVAGKAAEFGLAVITPIELAKLIDDSLLLKLTSIGRSGTGVERGKSGGMWRKTRFGTPNNSRVFKGI